MAVYEGKDIPQINERELHEYRTEEEAKVEQNRVDLLTLSEDYSHIHPEMSSSFRALAQMENFSKLPQDGFIAIVEVARSNELSPNELNRVLFKPEIATAEQKKEVFAPRHWSQGLKTASELFLKTNGFRGPQIIKIHTGMYGGKSSTSLAIAQAAPTLKQIWTTWQYETKVTVRALPMNNEHGYYTLDATPFSRANKNLILSQIMSSHDQIWIADECTFVDHDLVIDAINESLYMGTTVVLAGLQNDVRGNELETSRRLNQHDFNVEVHEIQCKAYVPYQEDLTEGIATESQRHVLLSNTPGTPHVIDLFAHVELPKTYTHAVTYTPAEASHHISRLAQVSSRGSKAIRDIVDPNPLVAHKMVETRDAIQDLHNEIAKQEA